MIYGDHGNLRDNEEGEKGNQSNIFSKLSQINPNKTKKQTFRVMFLMLIFVL